MGDIGPPTQRGVDHLGISVRDLARSEAFYCDVLGGHIIFRRHDAGWGQRSVVWLGPHAIDLNEFTDNDTTPFDPRRAGLDHLGFAAASMEELEAWAGWLDAHAVQRSQIRDVRLDAVQDEHAPTIGAMFDFLDPDGIQLEFTYIDVSRLPAMAHGYSASTT